MEAIEIKTLKKVYKSGSKNVIALNDINKKFSYGNFYLINGHSGSGKSTLLRIIGLIDAPTEGKIFINGKDISFLSSRELASLRNREIGFIFQDFYLDKYLTALENVTMPMLINKEFHSKKDVVSRSIELLENVGLKNRIKHYPKELSGGEQQRVAIARAMANNPKIILADEPTGNLDVDNEKIVFGKLKELASSGKCVIMVSHSKDALKYADEVIELKEGVFK